MAEARAGRQAADTPTDPAGGRTADVRAQLQRILGSEAFQAAEALRNLLVFVVEETLAGRADHLKEYVLGAIVLGKGQAFDPKVDPIVRVQMRRLRERLARYYATAGAGDPLLIELSRGSYLPAIHPHVPRIRTDAGSDPSRAWSQFSAYEDDLKARYLLAQRHVAAVREAAIRAEENLQTCPSYAPAYVTLAECYRMLTALEVLPPAEVVPKMKAACAQALKLDPHLGEAHAALAGVLAWEWNFAAADEEYAVALGCGSESGLTYQRYALHLAAFRRFTEAMDCANRACELDPLAPACEHARGVVHYWMRDYARALECANRAVAMAPGFGMGHHLQGFIYLHLNEYRPAVDALERATRLSGASSFDRGYQAYGLGRAGERDQARGILADLVATAQLQYVAPLSIAHCHLGLEDFEAVLTWIERAYAPGIGQWPYFLAAPFYEPLFRFRRFRRLIDRIGLPTPAARTR